MAEALRAEQMRALRSRLGLGAGRATDAAQADEEEGLGSAVGADAVAAAAAAPEEAEAAECEAARKRAADKAHADAVADRVTAMRAAREAGSSGDDSSASLAPEAEPAATEGARRARALQKLQSMHRIEQQREQERYRGEQQSALLESAKASMPRVLQASVSEGGAPDGGVPYRMQRLALRQPAPSSGEFTLAQLQQTKAAAPPPPPPGNRPL